jgi:hypothetical protein
LSRPVYPNAFVNFSILGLVYAVAVLSSIIPLTFIISTVRPNHLPISFLFVVEVKSEVSPLVRPLEFSLPMHPIFLPCPLIAATIVPEVVTLAVDIPTF